MISILQLGNPILRQVSQPVDSISPEISSVIQEMINTLTKVNGVGLAAPQLGYTDRIILIRPKPTKTRPHLRDHGPIIMINPQIEIVDHTIIHDREGCLSIPKSDLESMIYGKVPRYQSIRVSFQDEHGIQQEGLHEDFIARIIQHEIDHLNGILFIDTVDMSTLCSYDEYQKQVQTTVS